MSEGATMARGTQHRKDMTTMTETMKMACPGCGREIVAKSDGCFPRHYRPAPWTRGGVMAKMVCPASGRTPADPMCTASPYRP